MTLTATTKTKAKKILSGSAKPKRKKSLDEKTLKTKPAPAETVKQKKDEDEPARKAKKAKVTIVEPVKEEKEVQRPKPKTKAKAVKPPKEKQSAKTKILAPSPESDSESEVKEPQKKQKKSQTKSSTTNPAAKQPPKLISANTYAKPTKTPISNAKSTNVKQKAKSPSPSLSDFDENVDNEGEEEEEGMIEEHEEEHEEDVHLHGFSTDEDDSSDEDEAVDNPSLSSFEISKLPTVAKDDESVKRKLEKAKRQPTEERGVIYIGRLPHGFYEDQLKGYFSQFGDITRLRLSRNKKTGKCKHYGFIEFDSSSVAQIVAETMDNYLLSGHILKCKLIPKDEVHPELWIGANRKWRVVPRDRIARVQQNKPRTSEQTARATQRLIKRQNARKRKLEALGIEYEFNAVSYKKPKAAEKA